MDSLTVRSHRGPYTVAFGPAFDGLQSGLTAREHLLIDRRVAELYGDRLKAALSGPSVLRIEAVEASKSLDAVPAYVRHLLERGVRRDHTLIAVGGGIIQDITAFIAAILLRGVPWRFYPTTLLAQADSCIGSKTSINVGPYKNQVGTFTPPQEVLIAAEVLSTLSDTDMRSGIGEMIKVHIIAGWPQTRALAADYPRLAGDRALLLRSLRRSLEIKQTLVELDEFDRDQRLIMNYGHTFGHAIESATDYAIPHGIAVTIGMDMANYVSWQLDLIETPVYEELRGLLAANAAGFERVPIPEERFFAALSKDKKNVVGEVSLILLRGPGEVFRTRRPLDDQFRQWCRAYWSRLGTVSALT